MNVLILALLSLVLSQSYCWAFNAHLGQVDKRDFPVVRLYLDIVDTRGRPVEGLPQADFQVFEDGTLVDLISFADPLQYRPLTTVLVLDRSGSMADNGKIEALKAAASSYVRLMKSEDKIGVIAFANRTQEMQPPIAQKRPLYEALERLQASGGTALYDAVFEGIQSVSKLSGRRIVLALSDGIDNDSWKSMEAVVNLARRHGVPIYTIGLGAGSEGIAEEALRFLAANTGGLYFHAPSPQDLVQVYELLSRRFQAGYELTYASPRPMEDGTTRMVSITIHSQSNAAPATNSYYVPGVIIPSADTGLFIGLLVPLVLLVGVPAILRRLGPIAVHRGLRSGLSRTRRALLPRTGDRTAKQKLYLVPVTDAIPSKPFRLKGEPLAKLLRRPDLGVELG